MKKKIANRNRPKNLILKTHGFVRQFTEESDDKTEGDKEEEIVHMSIMPPLEDLKEQVKEGKGIKILTPNNLLTSRPVLLAQIKAGNNSYKLKNEIRQILYLLYQHNKITNKLYNNLSKSL